MERLEEFDRLHGFTFFEAHEQMAKGSDGMLAQVITLRFYNNKHVMIDVYLIDGEYSFSEPYAVNDEFDAIDN